MTKVKKVSLFSPAYEGKWLVPQTFALLLKIFI